MLYLIEITACSTLLFAVYVLLLKNRAPHRWNRLYLLLCAALPVVMEAKMVRNHFKDKPVTFVYVSLDYNDTIWKKAIKDFGIDGINTRLDKGKESALVQQYEAGATPAHYLIDKDGLFAKVDAVESPANSERLIAQIEKLLQ